MYKWICILPIHAVQGSAVVIFREGGGGGVGVVIKGQQVDRNVQCLDCGGRNTNLHM